MIRAATVLIVAAIAVAAAVWLAERPGSVRLDWQGYRIETSLAMLLIGVAAIAVAAAFAYRLWRGLRRLPRSVRRARRAGRERRGYRALTQGMVAAAAGDPAEARRQAKRARTLLDAPPLTLLLSAQAAQLDGDEAAAAAYFTAMHDNPETAFLGVRGLLTQALRQGDKTAARALAREAHDLRPDAKWPSEALFDLEIGAGDWAAALALIEGAKKTLDPARFKRRKAAILFEQSRAAEADALPGQAQDLARAAWRLDPGFVPFIAQLARLLTRPGASSAARREAARMIERAWAETPHPALARAFAGAGAGEAADAPDAYTQVKRFEKLCARNPDDMESDIALAEAALIAQIWGQARQHLERAIARSNQNPAAQSRPPARLCRLMAALEEGEARDTDAQQLWLKRAAEAPPDPAWMCDDCGAAAAEWRARCAACGAFDSQSWRPPPRGDMPALAAPLTPVAVRAVEQDGTSP